MNIGKDTVIGIVGGMGPEAGIMLYNSILSQTNAQCDQEHLSVILMSFPLEVTDRTAFLEGVVTVNPAYNVAKIIHRLWMAGAGVAGIACNTVYVPRIFNVIVKELDRLKCRIKLLHMPEETCRCIHSIHPGARRIGLLATTGTYKYGEYGALLEKLGYEVILPDERFQRDIIHRMIYDPQAGLKANPGVITEQVQSWMDEAITFFKQENADAIILGCTELPAVLNRKKEIHGMPVVNCIEAMAGALIKEAASPVKKELKIISSY